MRHTGLHYRLNCDDYVLHQDNAPVGALLAEVAVVFAVDPHDGLWTRCKHGEPQKMHAWVQRQRQAQGGKPGLADALHVLEGKLPLTDLNGCIANASRVEVLVRNCFALTQEHASRTFKLDGKSVQDHPGLLSSLTAVSPQRAFERNDNDVIDVQSTDVTATPGARA